MLQRAAPEQLLRELLRQTPHPRAGNLGIMLVSGQTFVFVSLMLWEDHTHCLLFLLKSLSKVAKCRDTHGV